MRRKMLYDTGATGQKVKNVAAIAVALGTKAVSENQKLWGAVCVAVLH
jgi:hypothetical protein